MKWFRRNKGTRGSRFLQSLVGELEELDHLIRTERCATRKAALLKIVTDIRTKITAHAETVR